MRHSGDRPQDNRTYKSAFGANAIVKLSRKTLADRVGQKKPGDDAAKLSISEPKIVSDNRGQDGDRQPVDVVNQRGKKDQADDPPAQSSELEPRIHRS